MVQINRRFLVAAILFLCLLRAVQTVVAASPLGLPGLVGGDFIAYETAGRIVDQGDIRRLYDLTLQQRVGDAIETAAGVPVAQRFRLAFDNPPPVVLLLAPLALLPTAAGLAVWTMLNVACTLFVAWIFLRRTPPPGLTWLTLAFGLLVFWPDFLGLFYGQMMGLVLLLYALSAYWLRDDHPGRAGVALALLAAIKPQYAVFLLLIVLVQWWWRAIVAAVLGGGVLALLSVVLVGLGGMRSYLGEIGALDPYRGNGAYLIDPAVMVNWRALLLHVAPSLPETAGFLLTNILAVGTIGVALLVWRRAINMGQDPFGWPFLVATAATLLAAYHSHIHGAALLLVPYLLLQDRPSPALQRLIAFAFWPPCLALILLGPAALALRGAISLYFIAWLVAAIVTGWQQTALVKRSVEGRGLPEANRAGIALAAMLTEGAT